MFLPSYPWSHHEKLTGRDRLVYPECMSFITQHGKVFGETLPEICGHEKEIAEATSKPHEPVYLKETDLKLEDIQATFSVALHMHQPLVPTGVKLQNSLTPGLPGVQELTSNLDHMFRNGDEYNASVFAECYGRMGPIVSDLAKAGHRPRVMLDYSGELFFGLRKMGRQDIIDRLKPLVAEPTLRGKVEWLGTMWAHAVASSTPVPDLKLHMRAWQQEFAQTFGLEALARVRGFSPPEMHLPNHPDVAYEYVKALRECGYRWLLVQEHSVEELDGSGLRWKHLPHRLVVKNSRGEETSIIAIVKTQGSDTKLVAQMQPLYEAKGLGRVRLPGASASSPEIPQIVSQIADGENGGVMMNEFPQAYRQGIAHAGRGAVAPVCVTEYLELLEKAGIRDSDFPVLRPVRQGRVLSRITRWEDGAADRAIAEIKKEEGGFSMEGGSWTDNISWVNGYENVLTPMNQLSAEFHKKFDGRRTSRTRVTARLSTICSCRRRAASVTGGRALGRITLVRSSGAGRKC